jgi:molybdopterin synthase catalytic subunit
VGDLAVWVGAAAPHRDEAFKACRYVIDELKQRLPIWKKEHYIEGESAWVDCERCRAAGHGKARPRPRPWLPGPDSNQRPTD